MAKALPIPKVAPVLLRIPECGVEGRPPVVLQGLDGRHYPSRGGETMMGGRNVAMLMGARAKADGGLDQGRPFSGSR